ncbi:uncharacterized protein LOC101207813 isoform X1 [Cucumis sativus]|uniref:Nuclease associated modular domain-containing protein n=1 Tax=Cucumis sativus TaxID=3659 RepID=A0A0A0L0E1_CUCSA|nr:uncharacterized protein LOC101207813 isoform X1 [Cucumis sativus]KGN53591.1 hypothetical protein Csa_014799 [Cucumis sativus]
MDCHFTRMPYIHMRLLGTTFTVKLAPNPALWKISYYPVANINFPSNAAPINHQMSIVRNDSVFSPFNIFNRTSFSQAFLFMVDEGRNSNFGECYKSKCSSCSIEKQVLSNKDDSPENLETENDKEWQRRKKIGLANKGRVPWNKGKKHNLETRTRIKQRTIEALRDPEVRRKMSEYPRIHSDQVKVKISSSLRRVWGKRLMKKRLNETFFLSWMESIAVAAKKGGKEEQELDWDSYDKIKQETLHQELRRVAEKEKLKAMRENAKMKKVQRRVGKKEKGDDNAKTKKLKMCSRRRDEGKRKGKEDDNLRKKKKSTTIERSKLKQRLKKIRKKISINGAVTAQGSIASVAPQNPCWEKLDLDLIKKGQTWKEASLADQIQVAKNRKAESTACKVLIASTLAFQCTGVAER